MNARQPSMELKSLLQSRRDELMPAEVPDAYHGVWQRTLLQTPQWRDTSSRVLWLQTRHWHADLRLPPRRPDFAGVASLAECDDAQLAWLTTQQGFCGITQVDGDRCTWHRLQDFQPANGSRDTGRMTFEGERLIEIGIDADYLEVWTRLPEGHGGAAALELVTDGGTLPEQPAWLLIAGGCFMYVRGRRHPLPPATDLASLVAAARPTRAQLLEWLDVEISFGCHGGASPWRITHSTLPFREGRFVCHPGALQRRGHQLVVEDDGARHWLIRDWDEGIAL